MPLIICGDCKTEYSNFAEACPKCSRPTNSQKKVPNNKKTIKKTTKKSTSKNPDKLYNYVIENSPIYDKEIAESLEYKKYQEVVGNMITRNSLESVIQSILTFPPYKLSTLSIQNHLEEIYKISISFNDLDEEIFKDKELKIYLGKKIFYLLKIEDLADQFQSKNGHPPSIKEWAEYVKMPLIEFRNKLSEGYTAIEKIIKLNLGLIVHKIERTESLKFFSFQEALRIGAICLVSAAKGLSSPKEIINYPRYSWAVMSVYMPNIAERIAASSNLNPNLKKKIFEIKEKREFLCKRLGRTPSKEELARGMKFPIEKLTSLADYLDLSIMNTTPTGEENSILRLLIRKFNQKREKPRKLSYLIDYLKTPESKTFFNNLNSKERDLIKIKYGLDDGKLKRELEKAGNLELILESMSIISEAEVKATEYLYYWWVN